MKARIDIPTKLKRIFSPPRGHLRYRGAFGGRGSGKSFTFAKMAAVWGYAEPLRILCTREFQNSIKESFHAELKQAIESEPWLADAYDVGADYLRGQNGTEFIFKGLRHNSDAIKSLAKIDLCIVEEAEQIPESSWLVLEPTIREAKSEIWPIWNPKDKHSATNKRFIENPPPRSEFIKLNYCDNPWFPEELEEQRLHQQKVLDVHMYAHIWEGAYLEISDAIIFSNHYRIEEFTPSQFWDGPYFGSDFGFASDPTAAVKAWQYQNTLYVEYEAGRTKLELDDTALYLTEAIPDIAIHTIRADNARPESISYLKRHGLPGIKAADKGKNSIEEGIELLKSFDNIVIHPRCTGLLQEMRLYSYQTNRAGDILPKPVDAHNHYIDALRYALEPLLPSKTSYSNWAEMPAASEGSIWQ